MKKLMIILILTLGIVCESKAQKNSEIYYYLKVDGSSSLYDVYLVQIQDYGKKMIVNMASATDTYITSLYEEVQKKLNSYDWSPCHYSKDHSTDTYDTYVLDVNQYNLYSISKDRETFIYWQSFLKYASHCKRVSINDIQEMSKVKLPDFLE